MALQGTLEEHQRKDVGLEILLIDAPADQVGSRQILLKLSECDVLCRQRTPTWTTTITRPGTERALDRYKGCSSDLRAWFHVRPSSRTRIRHCNRERLLGR